MDMIGGFKPLDVAVRSFAVTGTAETEHQDQAAIDMVEHPKEGGILTWLRGFRHPFYGFPEKEKVLTIADIKQFVPIATKFCFKQPIKTLLGILFLISPKLLSRLGEKAIDAFLTGAHNSFQRHYLDPIRYTRPVGEIHRALTAVAQGNDNMDLKGKIERIRDTICLICQYDNAYILRLQDAFGEIDPVNFKKDPVSELRKALTIVSERELAPEMKKKISWLNSIFCMFIKSNKDYYRMLYAFAQVLDIKKIKFNRAEEYYCRKRFDYDFSGHRKNQDKLFGLPTKLETLMEEAILQRIQTRKSVVQSEFNKLTEQRDKLIAEEGGLDSRKDQINKEIRGLEKSADVLRGRWAEVQEEEGHLEELKKSDAKQQTKEEEKK